MNTTKALNKRIADLEGGNEASELSSLLILRTIHWPPPENRAPEIRHASGSGWWRVERGHHEPLDRFKARVVGTAKQAGCTVSFDE